MDISPYTTNATAHVVTGRAGTGKTETLVQEIKRMIEAGTSPADIIVFAASEPACNALQNRLTAALGHETRPPLVTTLFEYELSTLGSSQAVRFTHRRARILLRFEENILMEDMKTSGVQPKRLREMLRFFYRSWAELEPMDTAWFFSDEEERTHTLLKRYLDFMSAYVKPEVGRAAFDFLAHAQASSNAPHVSHVFVDDYQVLSKASQCFVSMLASTTLWIAADELAKATVVEPFPHYDGPAEFRTANPSCTVIALEESHKDRKVAQTLNRLLADEALGGQPELPCSARDEGAAAVEQFSRPFDEFDGIANLVQRELDDGTPASEIAIAVPTRLWKQNVTRALRRRNIATASDNGIVISGDVRDLEHCKEARFVTLLKLVADPDDQLALRCWCGFGDYLANSGIFARIAEERMPLSLSTPSAAETLATNALLRQESDRTRAALENAQAIISRIENQRGGTLLASIAFELAGNEDDIPAMLQDLPETLPENTTAATFCSILETRSAMPRTVTAGVRVGLLEDFIGLNVSAMIVAGLTNGLIPQRSYFDPTIVERDKRPAILAKDMGRVYCSAGKAHAKLILSCCTEALLADAERLQLKLYRVRLRNKERVCELHPSETIRAITGERFHD